MTTRSELRTAIRNFIGDAASAYATDSQLNDWINAAINDYSAHFPLLAEQTITASAGVHLYDLESNFLAAISVEYPQGEDPPRYLKRRAYTHPVFWFEDGYYDIVNRHDSGDVNELIISDTPPEGASAEEIVVSFHGGHDLLKSDSAVLSVPNQHEHILWQFVRWQLWMQLSTAEGMDPDPVKLLAATHEVNAYRAERAYRKALQEAQRAGSESGLAVWHMDKWDGKI